MKVSRRDFIYGTGGAVAASLIVPPSIAFADDYDTLRTRWTTQILGSGYDPNAEPFDSLLTAIGVRASELMALIQADNWPYPALDATEKSNVSNAFGDLVLLARAYSSPNTGFTGDAATRTAILDGLDVLTTDPFGYTVGSANWGPAWYQRTINTPKKLLDIMVMMHSHIGLARRTRCAAALDHFVTGDQHTAENEEETAGNRMDIARVYILRGIVGKSSSHIAQGRSMLSQPLALVTSGDGFYADGSFIQHECVPYAGSYGGAVLGGMSDLLTLLRGTTWDVTDPNLPNAYGWVEKSYAPFIYNGLMMDCVSGRAPFRGTHDNERGRGFMTAILLLGERASSSQRARWKSMVKGWLTRQYWYPVATYPYETVPEAAMINALMNDASVTPLAEPVRTDLFPSMDRLVCRRSNWALAVSMCSKRTTFYETGNSENLRGWHTNSGMTTWWGKDFGNGQYSDKYWPTVNPHRLPGTTVSKKALANGAGGEWSGTRPINTFTGGISDGFYAVVAQDTRGLQSTLRSKKSWFCLNDMVVCLGAGILSTDGVGVETTVDNRNLGSSGTQAFSVNGVNQSTSLSWSATLSGTKWAHLSGFGGYVFYGSGGATIKAVREPRTGRWSDVTSSGSTELLERKYLTFWYDHGTNPTNGTYAYALMPGATAAQTQARSDAGPTQLVVLENSAELQAVWAPGGFMGMSFWGTTHSTQAVSVDTRCCVMIVGPDEDGLTHIRVSDPTQELTTQVTLTWERYVWGIPGFAPNTTIVEWSAARLRVRFNVVGKKGASIDFPVWLEGPQG
jgi:hyaluronate lyase